ncbi:MAG: phosphatidate cytidylyltransferase [Pseudomonadota bacterium]
MSDLRERVASGFVLGIVFAAAAWMGGFAFLAILCAASCVIWAEWSGIRMPGMDDRLLLSGAIATVGIAVIIWITSGALEMVGVSLIVGVFVITTFVLRQPRASSGFFYAIALLVSAGMLRGSGDHWPGFVAICFLCAIVFATDIGAYFIGRKVGGPKLAVTISPNKTLSGALGGLISAVIGAVLVFVVFGLGPIWLAVALAVLLSVVSQAGDLYESWLKRRAGVKDSGRIIPGHGGVMDRVDGLLFAAFGLWLLSVVLGTWNAPARTFFS